MNDKLTHFSDKEKVVHDNSIILPENKSQIDNILSSEIIYVDKWNITIFQQKWKTYLYNFTWELIVELLDFKKIKTLTDNYIIYKQTNNNFSLYNTETNKLEQSNYSQITCIHSKEIELFYWIQSNSDTEYPYFVLENNENTNEKIVT